MATDKEFKRLKEVELTIKGASLDMLYLLEDTILKEINIKQRG